MENPPFLGEVPRRNSEAPNLKPFSWKTVRLEGGNQVVGMQILLVILDGNFSCKNCALFGLVVGTVMTGGLFGE